MSDGRVLAFGAIAVVATVGAIARARRGSAQPETASVAHPLRRVKQVLLFRNDLKVSKGKFAGQIAHATLDVFLRKSSLVRADSGSTICFPVGPEEIAWMEGEEYAKVVLTVTDEAALLRAYGLAREAGLPASLITDAGITEFHGVPTNTAVAIGPADAERIDRITGRDGLVPTKLA